MVACEHWYIQNYHRPSVVADRAKLGSVSYFIQLVTMSKLEPGINRRSLAVVPNVSAACSYKPWTYFREYKVHGAQRTNNNTRYNVPTLPLFNDITVSLTSVWRTPGWRHGSHGFTAQGVCLNICQFENHFRILCLLLYTSFK